LFHVGKGGEPRPARSILLGGRKKKKKEKEDTARPMMLVREGKKSNGHPYQSKGGKKKEENPKGAKMLFLAETGKEKGPRDNYLKQKKLTNMALQEREEFTLYCPNCRKKRGEKIRIVGKMSLLDQERRSLERGGKEKNSIVTGKKKKGHSGWFAKKNKKKTTLVDRGSEEKK